MPNKKGQSPKAKTAIDPNAVVILTDKQQKFAECYIKHANEKNRKRATIWELQSTESSYDHFMENKKVRAYIESKIGRSIADPPPESKKNNEALGADTTPEELKEALGLASLSGLLVAYNRELKNTWDPKDRKSILDSIRDMRHKFANEIEANVEKLHRLSDKELLELFIELATDLLGNRQAREALTALITSGPT